MKKSLLITGCSSGIGKCAAYKLREEGYHVFATARKLEDVEVLKNQGFDAFQLDLSDQHTIISTVKEISERNSGHLYGVINNAGYLQFGAIEDLAYQDILKQFETNTFGAIYLIQLLLPLMKKQGYGRIIQISSLLGLIPVPFFGAYVASKFALEGFSRVLKQELKGTNIFVSIINPGSTKTKFRDNGYVVFKNTIDIEHSIYYQNYTEIEKSYFNPSPKQLKWMLEPEKVVQQIQKALQEKKPKNRYYPAFYIKILIFIKNLLPESFFDKMVEKLSFKIKN